MRPLTGAALAIVLLFLALPTQAAHCATWTTSTTEFERGVLVVPDAGWPVYVVSSLCVSGCPYMAYSFTYFEANGIPGLQRADVMHNDTCHDMITPDSLL